MSEFDRRPLCELADCRMGETILSKDLDGSGYPIFSADSSAGAWGHKKQISKVLKRGSIIIGARGTIGNPRLPDHDEFGCTQTTIAVTPSSDVDPYYLKLALESSDIKSIAAQQAVPMLTIGQISQLEIPVPPLPEQKKIAEILSGIDKVITSRRNKVRSSELLKKALISRHIENIEGEIEEAKLDDLIHSIDSGWSPDCLKRPPFSDDEWSVLKTTSITWKGFDQHERKALPGNLLPREELVVEAEDILITRAGPADRTGVVAYAKNKAIKTMISDKIIRLRCDKSIIDPRFLSIFLSTNYAQSQMLKGKVGMASSQTNISQKLLREMRIRFPAMEEQMRISEIVGELQKTINQTQQSIEQTKKLKQSISSDLLSGRKRVSV